MIYISFGKFFRDRSIIKNILVRAMIRMETPSTLYSIKKTPESKACIKNMSHVKVILTITPQVSINNSSVNLQPLVSHHNQHS